MNNKNIGFPNDPVWELSGNYSPDGFFRGLKKLIPIEGFVFINVQRPERVATEIYEKYSIEKQLSLDPDYLKSLSKGNKSIFIFSNNFLNEMTNLSENLHPSEYCDDLLIFKDKVILDASGFNHEPFHVDGSIQEEQISEFSNLINVVFKKRYGVYGGVASSK